MWVTGFATICWACHGLDVGLAIRCVFGESVGLRLALLQIICFFSNFSSKIFFGLFFCLKVEQIIFYFLFNLRVFLILIEGVLNFFFLRVNK